jgi:hypothetical protein
MTAGADRSIADPPELPLRLARKLSVHKVQPRSPEAPGRPLPSQFRQRKTHRQKSLRTRYLMPPLAEFHRIDYPESVVDRSRQRMARLSLHAGKGSFFLGGD